MRTQDQAVRAAGRVLGIALLAGALAALLVGPPTPSQALPHLERYVELTASPIPLDLGAVGRPGTYDSTAVMSLHLAANCAHGGVVISTTGCQLDPDHVIPPERIFVKVPATGDYVALTHPVHVTPPAGPGIHDFQLSFRVQTEPTDRAGLYRGSFDLITEGARGAPAVPGPAVRYTLELQVYTAYTLEGGKCYFHLGNIYSAGEEDLTIHPAGSFTSNAPVYVGLNLSAMPNIDSGSFETGGGGGLTGRIFGGMIGTIDIAGRDISDESMDLRILLSWDGEPHKPPEYYGYSPDGNVPDTLWWLVSDGEPGTYTLDWEIRLLPEPDQADGNYYLESEIVVAPVL